MGWFVRELVQQIVQDLFIHVLKKLTLTLHPLLQAYKVGLQRLQKDYKRMVEQNNGTESAHPCTRFRSELQTVLHASPDLSDGCSQGLRLTPYMDLDVRD